MNDMNDNGKNDTMEHPGMKPADGTDDISVHRATMDGTAANGGETYGTATDDRTATGEADGGKATDAARPDATDGGDATDDADGGDADDAHTAGMPPLLAQLLEAGLTDEPTIDAIMGHPLYDAVRPYLRHGMAPRKSDRPDDPIERFDYDCEPAWMILLSPRFGARWFTLDQRMGLLANTDPMLLRLLLATVKQRFVSTHGRGGSPEFGCNQEYHHLIAGLVKALDHGGPDLLEALMRLVIIASRAGDYITVGPDEVRWRFED